MGLKLNLNKKKMIIGISSGVFVLIIILVIVLINSCSKNNDAAKKSISAKEKVYDVLSPVPGNNYSDVYGITGRLRTLENKKIGIVVNKKRSSKVIAECLANYATDGNIYYNIFQLTDDEMLSELDEDDNFFAWLNEVDAVVVLVGDCISSVKLAIDNAVLIEDRGKATTVLCNENYKKYANEAMDDNLMPSLRVIYEDIDEECIDKDIINNKIGTIHDDIEEALTKEITLEEKNKLLSSEEENKIIFTGNYEEIDLYYYQQGWTDGLPFMLPTQDAVDEMLRGTDLKASSNVAAIKNLGINISVETVAVNAVMAGCRPVDFPVVIAAIKATLDSNSGYYECVNSGSSCSPYIIVGGTIQESLEMGNGEDAYGVGNSSNSSIGRAVNLILRNIANIDGNNNNNNIYGNAGEYSNVIGEYNAGKAGLINWERIDEQASAYDKENAVYVGFQNSYKYYEVDDTDGKTIVDSINKISSSLNTGLTTFVITTAMAEKLERSGYSSESIINTIFYYISQNNYDIKTEDIGVLMVEGTQTDGVLVICSTHGSGKRIYENIELPKKWNELLGEYSYNRYAVDKGEKTDESIIAIEATDEAYDETFYIESLIDNRDYYLRDETDGLPVIVATEENVNEMLKGTDYKPDYVLGTIKGKKITVRMAAINAVMAGCLPTYFSCITSAIENLCYDGLQTENLLYGKNELSVILEINSTINEQVGINDSSNVIGAGNRANATIGRAVNLILKNIVNVKENDAFGNSLEMSVVVAEDNQVIIPDGFKGEENTIVLNYVSSSVYHMMPGLSGDEIIQGIIDGAAKYAEKNTLIIITSKQAELISDHGYSKETFAEHIISTTQKEIQNLDFKVINASEKTGVLFMTSNIVYDKQTSELEIVDNWDELVKEYRSYTDISSEIPVSIEVVKQPHKTTYIAGAETFDEEGLVVKANFENGATALISNNDLNYSVNELLDLTDSIIDISYKGISTSISVDVVPRILTSLVITTEPTKMNYEVGEKFDSEGMEITARYNSGHSYVINSSEYEIIEPETLSTKNNNIIIKYGDVVTNLEVSVKGKNIDKSNANTIKINEFTAKVKEDKIILNVDIDKSKEYEYLFYVTDLDWHMCTPAVDKYGKFIKYDEKYVTYESIEHSLEWYERHFINNSKYSIINDFSSKNRITVENDQRSKYFFVVVKDENDNTAMACTMLNNGETVYSNETEEGYVTLRVRQYANNTNIPYIYAWDNSEHELTGKWPGVAMTKDEELQDGWYKTTLKCDESYNFIVTNSTGSAQSSDITDNMGDVWAVINKPILSSGENCVTLCNNEAPENNSSAVNIHIKTYSANSNIPYVYAWKSNMLQLTNEWPGNAAKRDTSLGENWYTTTVYPEGSYNFVLTNALGDQQTMDITGMEGDIWVVVTKDYFVVNSPCFNIFKNEEDALKTNKLYVKHPDNCNEIPYLYVEQGSYRPLGKWPGAEMNRYYELSGNWYEIGLDTSKDFTFEITNRLGSYKSDTLNGQAGNLEVIINTFDENSQVDIDNSLAFRDIEIIKVD